MERPLLRPSRSSGWTMSSFCPTREAFFIVQTTLPITRPSSTLFLSRGGEFGLVQCVEMHFIDDADNRGVHGPVLALAAMRAELPVTTSTVSRNPESTV